MSEVLIYGDIYSFTAERFISDINAITDGELTVRIDTDGGDPQSTFGMVAKFNEFEGKKTVKVDGRANSSGFFFVAMTENVEALDASEFIVHRAAFPEWVEASEHFDDDMKARLTSVNKVLRSSFEKKVDVKAFEEMKDVRVKDIFSMDSRIDVSLTAKEAKKIGLINKINKLTPQLKADIDSKKFEIAANYKSQQVNTNTEQPKVEKMTKEELMAKHPELYASAVAEGVTNKEAEITAEADRVKAEKELREKIRAEVVAKIEAETKAKLEAESATTVKTGEVENAQLTEIEKMQAKIDKDLNLPKK